MRKKILIDTDPGRDDAIAILVALASPELDVAGIVAVAGNVPLHHTERNALQIVDLAGRTDIPVYAGCDAPLERELVTAVYIHGETGLDGYELPAPKCSLEAEHGVDFIVRTLRSAEPRTVTIAALGPLTNIATALMRAPDIGPRIRELVMMGGGFSEAGNIRPSAEFNVYADPDAAALVLRSGIPIAMAALDVTHQLVATPERIEAFAALGNAAGIAAAALADFRKYGIERFRGKGAPIHDACVTAYLLEPDMFGGKLVNVEVETKSELTLGTTVVDWWEVTDRAPNVNFLRTVDAERFWALLTERLARLP